MSPDETPAGAPEDSPSQSDDGGVDVDVMYATSTAFGSAHVGELEAAQTAVGSASVDGDATFSASAVGMLTCKDVSMRQTYAGAIMAEGNATMKQSGASAISAVGKQAQRDQAPNAVDAVDRNGTHHVV